MDNAAEQRTAAVHVLVPAEHLRRLLAIEAEAQRAVTKVEQHERLCYGRIRLGAFDRLRDALSPNRKD